MALSVVADITKGRKQDVWGTRRVTLFTVNLGASYVTNGMPCDPKLLAGFVGKVDRVLLFPRYASGATGTLTRQFQYDIVNKKIVVIITSTGAENTNAGDVSACVLDVLAISD